MVHGKYTLPSGRFHDRVHGQVRELFGLEIKFDMNICLHLIVIFTQEI